ncbi:MAG: hypothetical protein RIR70_2228, partial [Pseudomonadota bacterium]
TKHGQWRLARQKILRGHFEKCVGKMRRFTIWPRPKVGYHPHLLFSMKVYQMPALRPQRLILLLTCLVAPLAASFAARANPFETTLPNGLKVVVKEDRRAPSVVHMVWYRAGAIDEVDGTSGVAHVLEHLMFKGTKTRKSGEFNKLVAAAGGRDNAFTNQDYTAYFQQVPASALPQMMALEADRMVNLVLTEEEFSKEIKVVMEERRWRTDDKPAGVLYERLMANVFQAHPYRRPVIGWMNDLEAMTAQDARDWYQRWYTPNNATVVVVGDVDHRAVFKLAEKAYGKIQKRALPTRKPRAEPEQLGIKRLTVKAPAELPVVSMAWRVPMLRDVEKDRESYALEVLSAVLDGNNTSRLPRNLVRGTQVAQSAGAGYDGTGRGEGLFVMEGTPATGKTVAQMEAALRAEIERIQREGVTAEELERVKTQIIASQVYKRDSLFGQAMEIGQMEVIGMSWRDTERIIEKLQTVSAEEVQAVAQKYFKDDTLTVAVLEPQPMAHASAKKPLGLRH